MLSAVGCRISCAVALLALSCAGQQAPEQKETCSVAGKVTSATGGEPLRKVTIYLFTNEGKPPISYVSISDAEGNFSIENVEPGSYRLKGERFGYLTTEFGAKDRRDKGSELQLTAGEKIDTVRLELVPQAVISGRVVDQDGDPWTAGSAGVSRLIWRNGKLDLQGYESDRLDDHGEFRITGLPPGRYFVAVTPHENREYSDAILAGKTRPEREQETWYPGTLDSQSAIPLLLKAGQEITGIEIRIRKSPVFRITGKVTRLPAERVAGSFTSPRLAAIPKSGQGPNHGGTLRPDGSFEIRRVPPGEYAIRISQASDSFRSVVAPAKLGQVNISVQDRDVDGVAIEVVPPRKLEGHVRFEGDEKVKLSELRIWLNRAEGSTPFPPRVHEDGSFAFDTIGAERYQVLVHSETDDVYLKTVRLGDTESKDGALDLTRDKNSKVELLVSAKGAQIQGTVETTSPKDCHVWLIPDTADLEQRERRAQAGVFNQSGAFTIRNITPGSYTLYVWQDLPDDIWKNPEFLVEVKGKGTAISLAEGDRKQTKASLISSSETAGLRTKLGIE